MWWQRRADVLRLERVHLQSVAARPLQHVIHSLTCCVVVRWRRVADSAHIHLGVVGVQMTV